MLIVRYILLEKDGYEAYRAKIVRTSIYVYYLSTNVNYNKYLMCKDVQNPLGHVAIKSDQILRAHYHIHTDRLRLHGILNFS